MRTARPRREVSAQCSPQRRWSRGSAPQHDLERGRPNRASERLSARNVVVSDLGAHYAHDGASSRRPPHQERACLPVTANLPQSSAGSCWSRDGGGDRDSAGVRSRPVHEVQPPPDKTVAGAERDGIAACSTAIRGGASPPHGRRSSPERIRCGQALAQTPRAAKVTCAPCM